MKKFFASLFLGCFFVTAALAQTSNLIVFSEQGERFLVILNGIQQNEKPQTNVKVTGLNAPNYKMKVVFENASLGELDKNIMIDYSSELTVAVKRNNKGEYVVRFVSQVPIAQAPVSAPNQSVVGYHTTPFPAGQTTTTTTTTTTSGSGVGTGVNMGVYDNGMNVNMNINVGGVGTTTQTTQTTQTTTTTNFGAPVPAQPQQRSQVYQMPGYSGPVGCPWPVAPGDFQAMKNTIGSKSFEDSRLNIAKQVISSNCLLSSQVRELMMLLSFEDTRLELAKYAYGFTYDIGNYFVVNDAFQFESSISELNAHINSFRR